MAIIGIICFLAVTSGTKNAMGGSSLGENIPKNNHIDTTAGSCFPPPEGITGWWPGDGNTNDIIGGRSAALHGNATAGPGLVSQAFILDGDGDFVDVPHDPVLNLGTGDFTVALWVFFNDTAGEQVLTERWIQRFPEEPGDLGSEGWTLTKTDDDRLLLATADEDVSSSLPIPVGTWVHFAATRRAGKIKVFMNGVPVAEGFSILNLDSTSSLKFGHRGNPTDTPGSQDPRGFYLNGGIDEVQLFVGKALSEEQIKAIFESGSTGLCKQSRPLLNLPLVFNNYCPDFFDDFNTVTGVWEITDNNIFRTEYFNGGYRMLLKQYGAVAVIPNLCLRKSYTVEVDVRWNGLPNGAYGILFGILDNIATAFLVIPDRGLYWLVDIYPGGSFNQITPPTFSPAIKPGAAWNHLKVDFINGGQYTNLFVNGTKLYTRYGAIIAPTRYGIGIIPYEGISSLDASFDTFRVYNNNQ